LVRLVDGLDDARRPEAVRLLEALLER